MFALETNELDHNPSHIIGATCNHPPSPRLLPTLLLGTLLARSAHVSSLFPETPAHELLHLFRADLRTLLQMLIRDCCLFVWLLECAYRLLVVSLVPPKLSLRVHYLTLQASLFCIYSPWLPSGPRLTHFCDAVCSFLSCIHFIWADFSFQLTVTPLLRACTTVIPFYNPVRSFTFFLTFEPRRCSPSILPPRKVANLFTFFTLFPCKLWQTAWVCEDLCLSFLAKRRPAHPSHSLLPAVEQ